MITDERLAKGANHRPLPRKGNIFKEKEFERERTPRLWFQHFTHNLWILVFGESKL